jgi:hypothetical protein
MAYLPNPQQCRFRNENGLSGKDMAAFVMDAALQHG